jgi:hypothetical protein
LFPAPAVKVVAEASKILQPGSQLTSVLIRTERTPVRCLHPTCNHRAKVCCSNNKQQVSSRDRNIFGVNLLNSSSGPKSKTFQHIEVREKHNHQTK